MDYDKLIDRLNAKLQSYAAYTDSEFAHVMEDAIAAIEALRADLEQERAHRIHAEQHADAFQKDCERINAELERVKAERDGAVESIPHECKTCVYHTVFFNGCTPDHDCTNPDGGCSNNYDRWRWRGPQKED